MKNRGFPAGDPWASCILCDAKKVQQRHSNGYYVGMLSQTAKFRQLTPNNGRRNPYQVSIRAADGVLLESLTERGERANAPRTVDQSAAALDHLI